MLKNTCFHLMCIVGNYYGTPRPLKNAPNLPSRINRQVVNVTSLGDDDDDNDRASSSAGSQPNGLSNFDNYTNGSNDQMYVILY